MFVAFSYSTCGGTRWTFWSLWSEAVVECGEIFSAVPIVPIIRSLSQEWILSCGLMSTRMRGFGLCMETRSDPQPIILTLLDFFVFIYRKEILVFSFRCVTGAKSSPTWIRKLQCTLLLALLWVLPKPLCHCQHFSNRINANTDYSIHKNNNRYCSPSFLRSSQSAARVLHQLFLWLGSFWCGVEQCRACFTL